MANNVKKMNLIIFSWSVLIAGMIASTISWFFVLQHFPLMIFRVLPFLILISLVTLVTNMIAKNNERKKTMFHIVVLLSLGCLSVMIGMFLSAGLVFDSMIF
jgi:hypothetical protein